MTFSCKYANLAFVQKISNQILIDMLGCSKQDPSLSIKDCSKKLGYNHTTVYNWYRNLKSGKWEAGYSKTEDSEPLNESVVDDFVNSFSFSQNSSKILKKLVTKKCLTNSYCYAKQFKILKRLFKKYPNIDFWLNVDFGEPKDDILLYIGKAEQNLHKKFIDFTAKDGYTKFNYDYKPKKREPRDKKKKNIWDYY